jgi:hypothetical protein
VRGSSSTATSGRPASRSAPTSGLVSSAGTNAWNGTLLGSRSARAARPVTPLSGPSAARPGGSSG